MAVSPTDGFDFAIDLALPWAMADAGLLRNIHKD
jgi:hypothetical protein